MPESSSRSVDKDMKNKCNISNIINLDDEDIRIDILNDDNKKDNKCLEENCLEQPCFNFDSENKGI